MSIMLSGDSDYQPRITRNCLSATLKPDQLGQLDRALPKPHSWIGESLRIGVPGGERGEGREANARGE